MGSTDESDRKRRHLNNHSSVSPPLKKQAPMGPSSEDKKVDAGVLQYQNHMLTQQLDFHRSQIQDMGEKFNLLNSRQSSFDDTLISVNRCWNELVDDLELLTVRAQPSTTGLKVQELTNFSNDKAKTTVPPEETFLQRLLDSGATQSTSTNCKSVEAAIVERKSTTVKTMKYLVQAIDTQRSKNEELCAFLRDQLSTDEAGKRLQEVDKDLRLEINCMRSTMDDLHVKHKAITNEMRAIQDNYYKDQSEITRLTGELEETIAELETSRRKIAALRNQKDSVPGPPTPGPLPAAKEQNDKGASQKSSKEVRDLEDALEDAKALAAHRLKELQEDHQSKLHLSEQLRRLQDAQIEEQKVLNSRPYQILHDQVKFFKFEIEKCQENIDQLQAERDNALRHEKEVGIRAEAGEIARRSAALAEARISELESKLQQCLTDRDALQFRLDEHTQLSARKDTVTELKVMISTLHKEMGMMQVQLNKFKEAAQEVCSLRADSQSLSSVLERKRAECKSLLTKVSDQTTTISSYKEEIKRLKESEQELKLILDMYEKESTEPRDIMELQQSECRVRAQVERLKEALDEHSLELRVKAANEAEAACQQRLAAAEAEIADLRQRLDASERLKLELRETLKAKNEEGEAYISEIETIGQAYEDMQTQNQRLLQQISERDDFNTKLVSESLKAKQQQTSLITEKQMIASRMQHATTSADFQRQRSARLEDQVRSYLDQLGKAAEENRQYSSAVDVAKRKIGEAEREAQSVRAALESVEKESEIRAQRAIDFEMQLEKERIDKKRLQEEVNMLNGKVTRLQLCSHDGGSRYQEEIKELRAMLKCSVCHDRQKEVAITKCFHVFCKVCVQKNLEMRHRKCPGCGIGFGLNDVKTIYL